MVRSPAAVVIDGLSDPVPDQIVHSTAVPFAAVTGPAASSSTGIYVLPIPPALELNVIADDRAGDRRGESAVAPAVADTAVSAEAPSSGESPHRGDSGRNFALLRVADFAIRSRGQSAEFTFRALEALDPPFFRLCCGRQVVCGL